MYEASPNSDFVGSFVLLFVAAIYAYCAFTQYRIARKIGCAENAWWSWVPILNTLLLMDMAGRERWWFFLCLIPLVNVIVFAVLWFDVAKACGFDGWIGLLVLLPILNFIALAILAFGGRPSTDDSFPQSGQIDPAKYQRVS